eukprot:m.10247 g.10247  ORF g.10247 m.10247 type:complete len:212 (-) comp7374_c0_seq1:68-703(-)
MGLFGNKAPDPKELVRSWKANLRKENRTLDRQITSIEREEAKIKQSVRDAARKGNTDVCKILAKSLVNSRKARHRIHASKAQINSVMMNMQNQLSMLKVAGTLEKSTVVMKAMSDLVKLPEIQATMAAMSREMAKAGLIEEMIEDTFESIEEDDVEEEAEEEVNKVLFELTKGQLGTVPDNKKLAHADEEEEEVEDDAEKAMRQRLEQLRS